MAPTILNLQQLRAERSVNAPVIVGPDGKSYSVGGLPLDTYLEIVELQTAFTQRDGSLDDLAGIFQRMKALVGQVLPGFPAGELTIEELMLTITAMQTEVGPQAESAGAEAGTPPGE